MINERISQRIDRVCIKPIVTELGAHFAAGGTIHDALQRRPDFQQILKDQNIDPRNKTIHALAGTGFVLGTVVLFEAARAKGLGMQSAVELAALMVPALSISRPDDKRSNDSRGRYEYIEKATDRTGSRPEIRHLVDEAQREPKQFGFKFFRRKGDKLGYGEFHQSFDRQPDGSIKRKVGPRVILHDDARSQFGEKFIAQQKRKGKMRDI